MDDLFMGLDHVQQALFALVQREHRPSAIMPWEWDAYISTPDKQVMLDLHMTYQMALMGRDWLRRNHELGPHWSIQVWRASPNDHSGGTT